MHSDRLLVSQAFRQVCRGEIPTPGNRIALSPKDNVLAGLGRPELMRALVRARQSPLPRGAEAGWVWRALLCELRLGRDNAHDYAAGFGIAGRGGFARCDGTLAHGRRR